MAVIDSQGRRLQDYAAEFTGLWQPTSVSYDGTHVIISLKAGILVRFDGWYGAGGTVILDIQGEHPKRSAQKDMFVRELSNAPYTTGRALSVTWGSICRALWRVAHPLATANSLAVPRHCAAIALQARLPTTWTTACLRRLT
jgi:hypothetical protein